VLPEADEVEVQIDDKDLKVDVYRSSGRGAVGATRPTRPSHHAPADRLVVSMQDEKSQIQNRAKAMQVLRSRLLKLEQDRQAAEASERRRDQSAAAAQREGPHYNFKENRVTDHRIGLTIYKLDKVLAGELDDVSDALVADDQARRLQEG
jgi:peptide chain release factor 1